MFTREKLIEIAEKENVCITKILKEEQINTIVEVRNQFNNKRNLRVVVGEEYEMTYVAVYSKEHPILELNLPYSWSEHADQLKGLLEKVFKEQRKKGFSVIKEELEKQRKIEEYFKNMDITDLETIGSPKGRW